MQSTSNKNTLLWLDKQETLKDSLISNPLIVIYRPKSEDFSLNNSKNSLFSTLEKLQKSGVRHVEIGWCTHPKWRALLLQIKDSFPNLILGAASVNTFEALKIASELDLAYSMSPFWDQNLQELAREQKHILIPGVFSPSEIHRASNFGYRLVKLFPAISLGINYISQIELPLGKLPFIIAAGGLKTSDIQPWLNKGYGAIVLGRGLLTGKEFDKNLKNWLIAKQKA